MVGVILLIVLFSAIMVFSKTRSYSDGAVTLVGGLLTAFAVEWTVGKFIGFTVVWVGFL